MKILHQIFLIVGISFLTIFDAAAQKNKTYEQQVEQQSRTIKKAYKNGKITPKEYDKLMKEQISIQQTIDKAARDGYIDAGEQKHIQSKLNRSKHRLRKYQNNNEY